MKSYELFATAPPALVADILEYCSASDKQLYRSAVDAVAQARKMRIVFLERQPRPERYRLMAAVLGRPGLAVVAANLIRFWLLKKHTGLLADFLDTLRIPHDKGVVEDLPESVSDDALLAAVESLLAKYPSDAVAVYLNAFNELNEARWSNLDLLLQSEPRLKFVKPGALGV
jgi:hypothetical protein